ncbi:MAG: phosphonoacetaldehyde reductase [Myxococcota bacterium]|nr:phosphonoacetaldehyde reductase [Myxococcota bacterium]
MKHFEGSSSIHELGACLDEIGTKSVFLMTGRASYGLSGAQASVEGLLGGREVVRFCDLQVNPLLGDVVNACEQFREHGCDTIVAVGGGSVLDTAKAVSALVESEEEPLAVLERRQPIAASGPRVIAIPTTSGTGSEATHFATVYHQGRKYSLADQRLVPWARIIDADLMASMSPTLTANTGLDCLTQAIESMWSVKATEESIACAREAMQLAWTHLGDAVHHNTPAARIAMARAACLAGRAINISFTTACHALSYFMTIEYGVDHGLAVSMTLPELLAYNAEVGEEDCLGDYERTTRLMNEICDFLGDGDPSRAAGNLREFIASLGVPTRLSEVNIDSVEKRASLVESVNLERLANNPRRLDQASLFRIIESIA